MKRIGYSILPLLAFAAFAATSASATPVPNSAVLHLRVFNDCTISILNTVNAYPGSIVIDDQNPVPPFCAGFANLHTWRFSTDGVNALQFQNGDEFAPTNFEMIIRPFLQLVSLRLSKLEFVEMGTHAIGLSWRDERR